MKRLGFWAVLGAALVLTGCGANTDELTQWMEQQKREVKPSVEPIAAPKKFVPQPYASITGIEPFSSQKVLAGTRMDSGQSNAMVAAQLRRRKEPLEAYPLDAMKMVGTVTRQGRPHALIEVDKLLHYVKSGEYIGQNYGQITKIGETELSLRELVQDAAGEWIERTTTLQLQEKAQ
ncbi:MAG TPA: pilus assembly protein PilP [Ideonella sp.]|jgi:type IV pilus assembly protein PilP|uniref:pilus assembly protein PilP n=1 Tax=Ideonella sp. TaxID=1929293 RepID=UPI002E34F14A|nr:pilus assembly protein PilP [Ideonella sp.]HEX5682443.1 pilus assembly protein PilP [Ideonella sp.]